MTVDEVYRETRSLAPNVNTLGVLRAIKSAIADVHGFGSGAWKFYQKHATFGTKTTYSTGTVAVTANSTTVTGTDTVWAITMNDSVIRINGEAPYAIASANGTAMTLAEAYRGASASGLTYTIYRDEYLLETDVHRLVALWDESNQRFLDNYGVREVAENEVNSHETGTPRYYSVRRGMILAATPTTETHMVRLYPAPDSVLQMRYFYYRKPTTPTGPSSTVDVPTSLEEAVLLGASYRLKRSAGRPDWATDKAEMLDVLRREWRNDLVGGDWRGLLGPGWDDTILKTIDWNRNPTLVPLN